MPRKRTSAGLPDARWWFITRKYPPAVGGMERLSYELTTRISNRRPTTVVAMRSRQWILPAFILTAVWRLLLACARREVEFVHLGDPVLAPLALVARSFRVPVAVTLHGLDIVCAKPAYWFWRKLFLRGLDAYICISEATRRAAIAAGLPPERLHVIGIGVDVPAATRVRAPRDADHLLFVGRLVRRKGLAWFVREVLPALAARRHALRLVVLGVGPEHAAIVAAARAAGVDDRLQWLSPRDDAQKAAWFARAAICVMPNVRVPGDIEGFGIVVLEAAAAGCPVVAADIEGLREAAAEGRAGTLVPSGDAHAWIRAIDERLGDPATSQRAGEVARRYVMRRCGWNEIVDAYERLFATTVAKFAGGA